MKKIAITGANGFVGSHLVRKLAPKYDVLCLVRENADTDLLPENADIRMIDYNNLSTISEVLKDCDILIHSAALTRARNWQTFKKINIDLPEDLLKISNEIKLQQFIFISSQAAAGPASDLYHPVQETDKCEPISMYGKSKFLAEKIIRDKADIPWTIVRPVSVFGPGDKDFLQYFKMIKKHIAPLIGFDKKNYNFIYVNDLVDLIDKTILNKKAFNETFFAAESKTYTMLEFIKSIELALNRKSLHLHIPHFLLSIAALMAGLLNKFSSRPPILNQEKVKEFKQKNWIVNTNKSEELLAFKTKSDLTKQIQETSNWYKSKGWL